MYHLRQKAAPRISRPEVDRWITEPRFRRFLERADGDRELAIGLYDWNAWVSALFLEAISYAEVMLRNSIDAQFPPVAHDEPARHSWLSSPELMSGRSLEIVSRAVERIERTGREATRAQLVSNLSFGFWRALFNRRYQGLWVSNLHAGFPNGTGDRSEVARLMAGLNSFRNRLAHHEPILDADLRRRHDELIDLLCLIDLDAADWLEARSGVLEALARRPG